MLRILWVMAGLAVCSQAAAVPAKPQSVVRVQPDGTEIVFAMRGDERGHYMLSEDGQLLMSRGNALYYAQIDADGQVVASDMLAHSAGLRTTAEKTYLAAFDTDKALKMLEQQHSATSRFATTTNHAINRDEATATIGNAVISGSPSSSSRTDDGGEHSQSYGIGLFPGSAYPTTGTPRGLVILVSYADVDFSVEDPQDYFYRFLNEEGFSDYGATGSARDYFVHCSNGVFRPNFDLYGPIQLDKEMAYYGGNNSNGDDQRAEEMIVEACNKLDATVDFSLYDCDGDGVIDNVYVIYAGYGEASSYLEDTVWPHSWDITSAYPRQRYYYDGVLLNHYACSNELEFEGSWDDKRPDGIGTFVHEFSHVMGLPDLYATSYSSAFTPGTWSVLDVGSYNNCSRTPPQYSAYERNALRWLSPIILSETEQITLPAISENVAYIMETATSKEFFLLENRQLQGWDAYLPGHGMLIWHIDYNETIWNLNTVNNTSSHQYVDLVEADNRRTSGTVAGDSWPGTFKKTTYDYNSAPQLITWTNDSLDIGIYEIEETGGLISFLCRNNATVEGENGITDVTIDQINNIIVRSGALKAEGEGAVEVYSIDGRMVRRGLAREWLSVIPGLYIVRNGSTAQKIRVP